jgi:hypothetical protein
MRPQQVFQSDFAVRDAPGYFRVEVQEFTGDLSSPERGPEGPQGPSGIHLCAPGVLSPDRNFPAVWS